MHFHVQTHTDDEDPYVTRDRVSTLYYAATQLDWLVDHEHESISALGEAREFESAYNAFTNVESWSALVANLRNMLVQADPDPAKRAPLYRYEPQCGPLWTSAADHVTDAVNATGPNGFALYSCELTECGPGAWVISTDGQPEADTFTREDFVEAWCLYGDVMTTWANDSDDAYEEGFDPADGDFGSDGATVTGYLTDAKREIGYLRDHTFTLNANDGTAVTFTMQWDTDVDATN